MLFDKKALKEEVPVLLSRHPAKYDGKRFVTRGVYVDRDVIERCAERGISVARLFSTLGNKVVAEYLDNLENKGE